MAGHLFVLVSPLAPRLQLAAGDDVDAVERNLNIVDVEPLRRIHLYARTRTIVYPVAVGNNPAVLGPDEDERLVGYGRR